MNKILPLLISILFCSAAVSAEQPVDMAVLNAINPVIHEVVKSIEAERGYSFASLDELKVAMASPDFQNKLKSEMQSFCAKSENANVLACH
jgi:hypothetical protein